MRELNQYLPWSVACFAAFSCLAAESTKPPPNKGVEAITVTGKNDDSSKRRQQTAAKTVFSREEILKYGDTSTVDVLKRLPGVSVAGSPGRRGGAIQMRGMAGYTQILINGEPAPAGFSLDDLSPDQIERIELMNAPTAEFSAQAVAGTINIILREAPKTRQREFSANLGGTPDHPYGGINLSYGDSLGEWSYKLGLYGAHYFYEDNFLRVTEGRDPTGVANYHEVVQGSSERRGNHGSLNPTFNWRNSAGETASVALSVVRSESRMHSDEMITPDGRSQLDYQQTTQELGAWLWQMQRVNASWNPKFSGGRSLQLRATASDQRNDGDERWRERPLSNSFYRLVDIQNRTNTQMYSQGGKFSQPWREAHSLAFGWDAELTDNEQLRSRIERTYKPGQSEQNKPIYRDNLTVHSRRLALFAQDEVEISPTWSGYGGLRWEQIQTESSDQDQQFSNRNGVWSPMLHSVWKFKEGSRDQIRASLTRSYRAPRHWELASKPQTTPLNSQTAPDYAGNPDLRPELAWGLDIALERYLKQQGVLSASLFMRDLQDVIRNQARQEQVNGEARWITRPRNVGHARSVGVELEAKFRLKELLDSELPLDLRINLGRYWSQIDDVPGPYNRLGEQMPASLNLGFDYKAKSLPWSFGGNLNWVPAYTLQVDGLTQQKLAAKQVLDLFARWQIGSGMSLRIAGNNLTEPKMRSERRVALHGGGGERVRQQQSSSERNLSASLEMRF